MSHRRARRRPSPTTLAEMATFARDARSRARAPFSGFSVGAALKTVGGEIVTGCNVESATYGLTVCAERVAVLKAVSEGLEDFDAVAIVTDTPRPTPPCGACRQVLWELCGNIVVHMATVRGRSRTLRLRDLLPHAFDEGNL